MAKYLCIFSMNERIVSDFAFNNDLDYLTFLFTHRKEIDWAKLIDQKTGETVDNYQNFRVVKPEYFNLRLTKEQFPNVNTLLMLNKQKLIWFINIINTYTKDVATELNENDPLIFHRVKQCSTEKDGFFIPSNLILVDKDKLMQKYYEVREELKDDEYKTRILKAFVDLEGFEIPIDNFLLN